jgi:hypothetical protein
MRISTNDHRYLLIKARKAACDWAVDGGFPLRRVHVHDVIVGIVKQEQREVRLRLRAGRPYSVSKSSAALFGEQVVRASSFATQGKSVCLWRPECTRARLNLAAI